MTQTTAYSVDAFIDDVREIFDATQDPLAQASGVAKQMELLLATPGWLEERLELPDEGGFGRYDLHLDEDYGHPGGGFWLMASVQKPESGQPAPRPRAAWVVYGVYDGAIKQTKWRWFYPGEGVDSVQIQETGDFVQEDGKVAFFLPGEIHNTLNVTDDRDDGRAVVVRLEIPEARPRSPLPVQPGRGHRGGDGPLGLAINTVAAGDCISTEKRLSQRAASRLIGVSRRAATQAAPAASRYGNSPPRAVRWATPGR